MTPGTKYDSDKPQWSLIPWRAAREVVSVLMFGAEKYAPENWKGVPDGFNRYMNGALRHTLARLNGEFVDQESGLPTLAHAICCLLFALWFDTDTVEDADSAEMLRAALDKARELKAKRTEAPVDDVAALGLRGGGK